jgi:glycosyltransferase involved in cell wall biosynthesis
MRSEPKIAFVTDALPAIGGGEKTLFAALEAFPNADLFTLIYNKNIFRNTPLANRKVNTSFLNLIPWAHQHHRLFLPLMPLAIEHLDLRDYDLVVSFNYAVANGARVRAKARHISYTYTPMRYAWNNFSIHGRRSRNGPLMQMLFQGFRRWDLTAASHIKEFGAISHVIQERIRLAYQREARIIYPPVEIERFHPNSQRRNYYIAVSRLVAHKRLDLVVEAFSRLSQPLVIVGDGPELTRLKRLASSNIRFLGYQNDEAVADLLGMAQGFVSAAEEDFGIAIVEAQAAGCPIISYGKGGASETVIDGVTGVFFTEQSVDSVIDAVKKFERIAPRFRSTDLVNNARQFSKSNFKNEFIAFLNR